MPRIAQNIAFNQVVLAFILTGLFLLSWQMQSALAINWDVSWLMEASKRLWQGGSYTHDFFENNPPLILYLYLPTVWMTNILSITPIHALQIEVYLLAVVSLCLCTRLITRLFDHQDNVLQTVLVITLALIYVIFPVYEFGQREHLVLLLGTPYVLLMSCRAEQRAITPVIAGCVGLMAALGFYLKPVFLFAPFLIECYYAGVTKNVTAWWRTEIKMMLLILALYLCVVFLRHSDYVFDVVPYMSRWVGIADHQPLLMIMKSHVFIFSLLAGVMGGMFYLFNHKPRWLVIMVLAWFGFTLSYLCQLSNWYYHVLPMFAYAVLVLVSMYVFILTSALSRKNTLLLNVFSCIIIAFLIVRQPLLWTVPVFYPFLYYVYFIIGFTTLLYFKKGFQSVASAFYSSVLVITAVLVGYAMNQVLYTSDWYHHAFIITTLIMLFTFIALSSRLFKINKLKETSFTLAFIVMMSFPFVFIETVYAVGIIKMQKITTLVSFLKKYAPNKNVYFFTTDLTVHNPALYYSNHTQSHSRFSFFLGLGGLVKASHLWTNASMKAIIENDQSRLINMVVDDLTSQKPYLIFVDHTQYKRGFTLYNIHNGRVEPHNIPFDYIVYFSQQKNFRQVWQHYHYLTTIRSQNGLYRQLRFEYQVYERNEGDG